MRDYTEQVDDQTATTTGLATPSPTRGSTPPTCSSAPPVDDPQSRRTPTAPYLNLRLVLPLLRTPRPLVLDLLLRQDPPMLHRPRHPHQRLLRPLRQRAQPRRDRRKRLVRLENLLPRLLLLVAFLLRVVSLVLVAVRAGRAGDALARDAGRALEKERAEGAALAELAAEVADLLGVLQLEAFERGVDG